jgi:hypothetical protein
MSAAVAMCALSVGALLELGLAAVIRSRATRRRESSPVTGMAATGSVKGR